MLRRRLLLNLRSMRFSADLMLLFASFCLSPAASRFSISSGRVLASRAARFLASSASAWAVASFWAMVRGGEGDGETRLG